MKYFVVPRRAANVLRMEYIAMALSLPLGIISHIFCIVYSGAEPKERNLN